mgnify:CR=1 FL=1
MNKFEIIAKWIHSESDEPISEIEWLHNKGMNGYWKRSIKQKKTYLKIMMM